MWFTRLRLAALVLALAAGPLAAAEAPKPRLALVMGNAAYSPEKGWSTLSHPVNDAEDMARFLGSVGFEVIKDTDLDRPKMIGLLDRLEKAIKAGHGGELVVVYYSGHGGAIGGQPYLIPLGASSALRRDGVSEVMRNDTLLNVNMTLMKALGKAPGRANLIILDSCRAETRVKGGGAKGAGDLEPLDGRLSPPSGTGIAFAAKAGSFAYEGGEGDRNSIFTGALLAKLAEPGVSIGNALGLAARSTQIRSQEVWGQIQEPEVSGSNIYAPLVLVPAKAPEPPPQASAPRQEVALVPPEPPQAPPRDRVVVPPGTYQSGSPALEKQSAYEQMMPAGADFHHRHVLKNTGPCTIVINGLTKHWSSVADSITSVESKEQRSTASNGSFIISNISRSISQGEEIDTVINFKTRPDFIGRDTVKTYIDWQYSSSGGSCSSQPNQLTLKTDVIGSTTPPPPPAGRPSCGSDRVDAGDGCDDGHASSVPRH